MTSSRPTESEARPARATLGEIAAALGAEALGDPSVVVTGAAHPADAGPDDLAIAMAPSYADALAASPARAALVWEGADWQAMGLLAAAVPPRPRFAMAEATARFRREPAPAPGIHPSAAVDPGAEIGPGAAIGPFVSIAAGVRIGARARILSHVSIAEGAEIGDDALIMEGARIGARVRIGARFIAQPAAVIGGDGFSFVTPEKGSVESAKATGAVSAEALNRVHVRIHSLGAVLIGDDVEVGACACIDRGTLRDTRIGSGSKIDNLVQVGHNVGIGENCLLCAQVGIAGSAEIGDRVVLGGKAGVADHVRIGDDCVVAAGSAVASSVAPRSVLMGAPAIQRDEFMRVMMATRRLPRMLERLRRGD